MRPTRPHTHTHRVITRHTQRHTLQRHDDLQQTRHLGVPVLGALAVPGAEQRQTDAALRVEVRVDALRRQRDVEDRGRLCGVLGTQLHVEEEERVLVRRAARTDDHHREQVGAVVEALDDDAARQTRGQQVDLRREGEMRRSGVAHGGTGLTSRFQALLNFGLPNVGRGELMNLCEQGADSTIANWPATETRTCEARDCNVALTSVLVGDRLARGHRAVRRVRLRVLRHDLQRALVVQQRFHWPHLVGLWLGLDRDVVENAVQRLVCIEAETRRLRRHDVRLAAQSVVDLS